MWTRCCIVKLNVDMMLYCETECGHDSCIVKLNVDMKAVL